MNSPSSPSHEAVSTPAVLQTYRLLVYQQDPGQNIFEVQDRRNIRFGDYELDASIAPGAHMMRFRLRDSCVTEVITPDDRRMPLTGRVHIAPCAGDQEHEQMVDERVNYITAMQTEILSDSLYRTTLREMQEYAEETGALTHCWRVRGSRYDSLSLLDFQWFRCEIHTQAWHLDATCGLVLRTQAIFENLDSAPTP